MIQHLPPHPSTVDPEPFADEDHPMRRLTRSAARGEPWTGENARRVQDVFDELAPSWAETRVDPLKAAVIDDAVERGGVPTDAMWVELGSGTGSGTRILDQRSARQISVDLSAEMLAHAPTGLAPKVRADSSRLPFPDDSFDAVLMINMILFPNEVDRVLRPGGAVVWVNTRGDQTPIHLEPEAVAEALPGDWGGIASRAGAGLWAVLRRR